MKKKVLVMFGGIAPEHEVSIITGLQVVEKMDRNLYDPIALFVDKQGKFQLLTGLNSRKDFFKAHKVEVSFGLDITGGFIKSAGFLGKKIYPAAAYLAFHGGTGESGPMQGLLEAVNIPFTSVNQEAAVITMNKQLTKQVLAGTTVKTVEGMSVFAIAIKANSAQVAKMAIDKLSLPVIVKPVHLGSSIGIKVARSEIELEKALIESAHIDNEILIEKFLTNFVEYNCSVRLISALTNGELEVSEIEKPVSQGEILSFADKYQRGGKKTGADGMASLQRELPAKIDARLREQIQTAAKTAFTACRCKGMVRIDFMYADNGELFLTEINPIPGSMSFYLWEATGIAFTQQITDLVEQAIRDYSVNKSTRLDYQSDIVQKFVAG